MSDPAYPPSEPPPVYHAPKDPVQGNSPPPQQPMQAFSAQPPPQGNPYNQPPPPYQPQPGMSAYPINAQTTLVVTPAVTSVPAPLKYGPAPQIMSCPHCKATITTSISHKIGLFTWMVVGIWALVGLMFCPLLWLCCCIPCCIPSCKDVQHSCPNCKQFLGFFSHYM